MPLEPDNQRNPTKPGTQGGLNTVLRAKSLKILQRERNRHLHSREHLLADDLSRMMGEPKKFSSYLGVSLRYHESDLRALAKRVVEKTDLPAEARGKYFFASLKGLVKKQREYSKNKKKNRKKKNTIKK